MGIVVLIINAHTKLIKHTLLQRKVCLQRIVYVMFKKNEITCTLQFLHLLEKNFFSCACFLFDFLKAFTYYLIHLILISWLLSLKGWHKEKLEMIFHAEIDIVECLIQKGSCLFAHVCVAAVWSLLCRGICHKSWNLNSNLTTSFL